jgi:hypothetical protein
VGCYPQCSWYLEPFSNSSQKQPAEPWVVHGMKFTEDGS